MPTPTPVTFSVGCAANDCARASHTFTTLPRRDAIAMALQGKCPTCGGALWVKAEGAKVQAENEQGGAWVIRCRVSGGLTGDREALLKGDDGQVETFATQAEAAARARDLTARMNHERSTARFTYTVEPAGGAR